MMNAKIAVLLMKQRERHQFCFCPFFCPDECLRMAEGIYLKFPNLEVYFHGGVNFEPYREQYKKKYPQRDLGTMKYTMPPKVFLLSGPQ
jgi:hypothetical protein